MYRKQTPSQVDEWGSMHGAERLQMSASCLMCLLKAVISLKSVETVNTAWIGEVPCIWTIYDGKLFQGHVTTSLFWRKKRIHLTSYILHARDWGGGEMIVKFDLSWSQRRSSYSCHCGRTLQQTLFSPSIPLFAPSLTTHTHSLRPSTQRDNWLTYWLRDLKWLVLRIKWTIN